MQIRSHNNSVQKELNSHKPESLNLQSAPPHLKPCTFVLPHGHWPTVLDCLCDSFPAIHRQHWLSRFERELVLDNHRQPIRHDRPHQTGLRIYYFREIANEKEIPFYESILYMDEHLLVADKPHFLPVTPSGDYVSQTLLSRLIARFQNPELQPLHRIDRHTAGLVLFSVQKKTRGLYQALFRDQKIDKCYEAIAPALPQLSFPHTRATRIVRGDPFFLSQEVDGEVNAQTIIDVIEQRGDLCRYALQPVSGKKHQLRLHMAALGAPICNDALYPVVNDAIADDYEKPLQLLASDVTFVDPLSGTPRYFKSELRLDW
ncbi:pseudouridine synthase [Tolumonas osonensis]|uniref:tRNA pseudouridine32 synthase/23S rRNA pseudouridine746 synthase n=1 Tax=Tolumonas osonensis TaxID=675874 RepID=A0A841GE28_9GAMM|nr:pseudouridine synthase [Tolumonas osonensis]MBB6055837.1 tRNA pseudouridine32 synthase/23S rRNA pseudouridine746 synthase [Tolumonas osonensis]